MPIESAVVLAAGEGMRLRPLTKYRPKPMLPVTNVPILEHVFDALVASGISEIHVVVGYKRDRVQEYFGFEYDGVPLTYHVQEQQLGSGHAVLQAQPGVDGPFLVVNGDQLTSPEIVDAVVEAHAAGEQLGTISVVESELASRYGAVSLDGDTVTDLVEKPGEGHHRLLNAGVYAFEPAIFDRIASTPAEDGERSLTTALTSAIETGSTLTGVRTEGLWRDATYPWDLLSLSAEMLDRSDEEVTIDPSATVADGAIVRAPVVVGPDAVVAPGAVVGPYTTVGRNASIGCNAVVEHTIVDEDTRIGPNATLVDSVTGRGVDIAAGVTIEGGDGDVRIGDRIHEEVELGAVVADRTELGGGVSAEPGTIVGAEASVATGVVLDGVVEDGVEVVR
ncbi:glucose-1-phosphate thymidylyltransferase [Haloferax larsenii JCM 13917]|nr:sugar phosphate nucleotidyltransferase [Haloferax larsenii]ELZ81360.1 glucose-1-phosphate thymidylyltransferase [Haloferax larsenii JCM 13917]